MATEVGQLFRLLKLCHVDTVLSRYIVPDDTIKTVVMYNCAWLPAVRDHGRMCLSSARGGQVQCFRHGEG